MSTAGGMGSVPGHGTKIPTCHAPHTPQKRKKQGWKLMWRKSVAFAIYYSWEMSHQIQPTPEYKCTSIHSTLECNSFKRLQTKAQGGFLAAFIPLVNSALQLLTSNQDYQKTPSVPNVRFHLFGFLSSGWV